MNTNPKSFFKSKKVECKKQKTKNWKLVKWKLKTELDKTENWNFNSDLVIFAF